MNNFFKNKKLSKRLPLIVCCFLIGLLLVALLETRRTAFAVLQQHTPGDVGVENLAKSTYLELYTLENELFYKKVFTYGGIVSSTDNINLAKNLIDIIKEEADPYLKDNPFFYKITLRLKGINPYTLKGFISEYYINSLVKVANIENSARHILKFYTVKKIKKEYNDDQLYRLLLNTMHFEKNVRGISGAANAFFNKSYSELAPLEQIYLIANALNPEGAFASEKFDESEKLARQYLYELYSRGFITSEVYTREFLRKLTLNRPVYVQRELAIADNVIKELRTMYPDMLFNDAAIRIFTYFSSRSYNASLAALNKVFMMRQDIDGAMVTINIDTGGIESAAARGSKTDSDNKALTLKKPIGTMFYPIIYASAFSNGINPYDLVNDKKYLFLKDGKEYTIPNGDDLYMGTVLVRDGLIKNLNNATLITAKNIGLNQVVATASVLGFKGVVTPDYDIISRGVEAAPADLAEVYAILANNGIHKRNSFIKNAIVDGQIRLPMKQEARPNAIPEISAYRTIHALQEVPVSGYAKDYDFIAGSAVISFNDGTNNWAAAMYGTYVTVVWLGSSVGIEKNYALAVLSDFQQNSLKNAKSLTLKKPSGVIFKKLIQRQERLWSRMPQRDTIWKHFLMNKFFLVLSGWNVCYS